MSCYTANSPLIPPPISFSACEPIVQFYEMLNVPTTQSSEYLGKQYTWHTESVGYSYLIKCSSDLRTAGYGVLEMRSSLEPSKLRTRRYFQENAKVDSATGIVSTKTPVFRLSREIQLPYPDTAKKN